jgi:hypothetical protein
MSVAVRKLTRKKWYIEDNKLPDEVDNIPSDAITSCMRTSGNTLSVWLTDSKNWDDIREILAVLFCTSDRPSSTDVILLPFDDLRSIEGIEVVETKGESPATDEVNDRHRDIAGLDYFAVGKVAKVMLENLHTENDAIIKKFTKSEVVKIVKETVEKEIINGYDLTPKWQKELKLPIKEVSNDSSS